MKDDYCLVKTVEHIELFWDVLISNNEIVVIYDEKFRLLRANEYYLKNITSEENALSNNILLFFPDRTIREIKVTLRTTSLKFTFSPGKLNSNIIYKCTLSRVESNGGKVIYLLLGKSAEGNNKTELTLPEYESHFRMIFEKSPDGIFLMNGETIVDCNPAAVRLFGHEREAIIGSTPFKLSPEFQPDGKKSEDKAREYISNAQSGKPQFFEWQHISGNSVPFISEITLTPVKIKENIVIQAFIRDISIRKNNETLQNAVLEISEAANEAENLDKLFKTIHTIVAKLMLAENFYIALYDEELNQISFPYFVDQVDETPEPRKPRKGFTEYVLFRGEPALLSPEQIDGLYETKEVDLIGSESIDWLGVPLKVKGKSIGVIAVQSYDADKRYTRVDKNILSFVSSQIAHVISRKQYESKLKESEKSLKEMNASKDRLFSIIAHDLKSPFTALLGFSEMMAVEAETLTKEEVKAYSENIFNVAKNVHNLLENLLHWSRFQTGRFTYKPEEFKLNAVINDVINLFSNNAKSKGISLINLTPKEYTAFGDMGMLQSTLRNLVSNSIKFTNENGKISIKVDEEGDLLRISVKDNGIGIGKSNIPKLFQIDIQYTTNGTSNEKGTGLGLLLSKEMVEKNGGTMLVESTKGKGSMFSFTIPRYKG